MIISFIIKRGVTNLDSIIIKIHKELKQNKAGYLFEIKPQPKGLMLTKIVFVLRKKMGLL